MNKKLFLVGMCGRSGSGKGYVSKIFMEYSIPSIDTDLVYKTMVGPSESISPCMAELCKNFGDEIINSDNSLNRQKMREIVFGESRESLQLLNKITHKYIIDETIKIAERLYNDGFPIVIVDAPLLFESMLHKKCDYLICVAASDETSIRRIISRDGISKKDAEKRLSSQMSLNDLIKKCDTVIYNEDTPDVKDRVAECAKMLKDLCKR